MSLAVHEPERPRGAPHPRHVRVGVERAEEARRAERRAARDRVEDRRRRAVEHLRRRWHIGVTKVVQRARQQRQQSSGWAGAAAHRSHTTSQASPLSHPGIAFESRGAHNHTQQGPAPNKAALRVTSTYDDDHDT